MNPVIHESQGTRIAEIPAGVKIYTVQDAIELIMQLYPQGISKIILHQESLHPDFFSLCTQLAGAILQKFVNYRAQLAIVGDFEHVESKSLSALIRESNRGNLVFFVKTPEIAKRILFERPGRMG